VTLYEAALYAREILRAERRAEWNRQRLYQMVNQSLGGDFKADRSLVDEEPKGPVNARGEWLKLADLMGAEIPEKVRRKLKNG
jgi:hypothetical protein